MQLALYRGEVFPERHVPSDLDRARWCAEA